MILFFYSWTASCAFQCSDWRCLSAHANLRLCEKINSVLMFTLNPKALETDEVIKLPNVSRWISWSRSRFNISHVERPQLDALKYLEKISAIPETWMDKFRTWQEQWLCSDLEAKTSEKASIRVHEVCLRTGMKLKRSNIKLSTHRDRGL